MSAWVSAALGVAPWAGVLTVAILAAARIIDKALDNQRLRIAQESNIPIVMRRSKDEETVWVLLDSDGRSVDVLPPPVPVDPPQLRSIDPPDQDPSARSG